MQDVCNESVALPVQCVSVNVSVSMYHSSDIQAREAVLDQERGNTQQRPQDASNKEEVHGAKSSVMIRILAR